jgi:hypothetical protein
MKPLSISRVMKQEAFMNGDQIATSWNELKDQSVFQWGRGSTDNGAGGQTQVIYRHDRRLERTL